MVLTIGTGWDQPAGYLARGWGWGWPFSRDPSVIQAKNFLCLGEWGSRMDSICRGDGLYLAGGLPALCRVPSLATAG